MKRKIVAKFLLKRLFYSTLVVLALSFITFAVLSIVPGDPAQMILGYAWNPEAGEALREKLGLNDPLHIRYLRFIWNALHGDLGSSYLDGRTVLSEIFRAYPSSLQLALTALIIASAIGLPVGIYSSIRENSKIDNFIRLGVIGGASFPVFYIGLMMIFIFSVQLRLLPTGGKGGLEHVILPSITLAAFSLVGIIRMTRACMLEVLCKDYIRTAKSKGLSERVVVLKHALRNASAPIITLMGLYLGITIGSTIVTEYVFSWPGLGRLTISAVLSRDIPIIQGCVITIAGTFVVINLALDIIYRLIDPRIPWN